MQNSIVVSKKQISCDGEACHSSHPKVYLNLKDVDQLRCPYCWTLYIVDKQNENQN